MSSPGRQAAHPLPRGWLRGDCPADRRCAGAWWGLAGWGRAMLLPLQPCLREYTKTGILRCLEVSRQLPRAWLHCPDPPRDLLSPGTWRCLHRCCWERGGSTEHLLLVSRAHPSSSTRATLPFKGHFCLSQFLKFKRKYRAQSWHFSSPVWSPCPRPGVRRKWD